ncbi:MAG: phosphate/phosphite/phosphonate ABC transporter substrate-binding protein [SAR324 cluster bacterium]|nr:phosphate/phosphite/phosphonate ABC transporter substrate-binding protein [SAR324 cluster bacterium]
MSFKIKLVFLLMICCFAVYLKPAASREYSVGIVPQFDARRIVQIWKPILDAVSKESGIQLDLVGSPNIPQFEIAFNAGKFDFAYMNPYHLVVAEKYQGYTPLVKDTGRKLFGVLVVRKDSPIRNIADLEGKTVAFPSPNALGAALMFRAEFSSRYDIKYTSKFVKSHSSVYLNVVLGQTDAGGGVQKTLQQQSAKIRDALRIVHETPKVAPHPFAVHPRVETAVRESIRKAFLQLGQSEQGKKMLASVPIKEIGTASMSDYEPLQEMGLEKYYVK